MMISYTVHVPKIMITGRGYLENTNMPTRLQVCLVMLFATVLQSCVTKLPDSVTAISLQTKNLHAIQTFVPAICYREKIRGTCTTWHVCQSNTEL